MLSNAVGSALDFESQPHNICTHSVWCVEKSCWHVSVMLIKGVGSGTQTPPIPDPHALQTLVLIFPREQTRSNFSLCGLNVETVRETGNSCC